MLINFVDATNDANHYTKPLLLYVLRTGVIFDQSFSLREWGFSTFLLT